VGDNLDQMDHHQRGEEGGVGDNLDQMDNRMNELTEGSGEEGGEQLTWIIGILV